MFHFCWYFSGNLNFRKGTSEQLGNPQSGRTNEKHGWRYQKKSPAKSAVSRPSSGRGRWKGHVHFYLSSAGEFLWGRMCTPDLLDQRLAIAEGRCQSYCQLPDLNGVPKVPTWMSLPSTGSFNSTTPFSPSANLCFWDGIYSALPVRNPAWSQLSLFLMSLWCVSLRPFLGKSKLACAGGHTEVSHFHGTWLRVRRGVTLAMLPMDTSRWSWKDSRIYHCNRSSMNFWILEAMSFSYWFYFYFLQKPIGWTLV